MFEAEMRSQKIRKKKPPGFQRRTARKMGDFDLSVSGEERIVLIPSAVPEHLNLWRLGAGEGRAENSRVGDGQMKQTLLTSRAQGEESLDGWGGGESEERFWACKCSSGNPCKEGTAHLDYQGTRQMLRNKRLPANDVRSPSRHKLWQEEFYFTKIYWLCSDTFISDWKVSISPRLVVPGKEVPGSLG